MSDYLDIAELVTGKVLAGEYDANAVDPASLPEPYNVAVKMRQDGADDAEIADRIGFHAYQVALTAAEKVNGLPLDYLKILDKAATRTDLARELAPAVRKLEHGEDIDVGRVKQALERLEREERVFVTLDKVEPSDEVWQPSYYHPFDEYLGGVPEGSMTVIGGPPGTGKTSLLCRMLINCAKAGKEVAFFSLEMQLRHIMMRMLELEPKMTKKARSRIHVTSGSYKASEIYTHATRLIANNNLYMVGIDFADRVRAERFGSDGVARIDSIYNTMADLATVTDTPVVVLSQLNDKYIGGRPRANHLRGSRLIEALGALVVLLYNPAMIDVDQGEDKILKWYPETAYLIASKSRFGFHEGSGYGAVQVGFTGASGWGDEGFAWLPLGGGA